MFLGQGHSLHIQIEPKNTRVAPGTSYDRAASAAQLKPWGRSMTEPTSNSAPTSLVARDQLRRAGNRCALFPSSPFRTKRILSSSTLPALYIPQHEQDQAGASKGSAILLCCGCDRDFLLPIWSEPPPLHILTAVHGPLQALSHGSDKETTHSSSTHSSKANDVVGPPTASSAGDRVNDAAVLGAKHEKTHDTLRDESVVPTT